MQISELAARVDRYVSDHGEDGRPIELGVDGLSVLRHRHPTSFEATLYVPVICLNLQGRKETTIGKCAVSLGAGESLIVSHDLPVTARVTEASPAKPYLAMILSLDLGIIRSLYDQVGETLLEDKEAGPLEVDRTDAALIDALARYFALAGNPVEAAVVGPLVRREIHFRLLTAPNGGMIRRLLRRDSHASRISRAIERIRRDYRASLSVKDLANVAGMSPSSFHEHFKSLTLTTPLQYQKKLQLMEARRLLSEEGRTVSSAAYEVGYESPTQFSREYSRKFGVSPRDDLSAGSQLIGGGTHAPTEDHSHIPEVVVLPIVIVLTEGFSDWEIAPLAGVGRAFYGAEISFASPDGGPLTSAAGLTVADTKRFGAPARGVVVVCGGPAFESDAVPDIVDSLRTARDNGCVVAGICGGTVALARAGLLDHVRHTSNGPGYLDGLVPDYAGAYLYVNQPFALRDDDIITAPAPAPASFAAEVLTAAGLDNDAAREIKSMLAREHTL